MSKPKGPMTRYSDAYTPRSSGNLCGDDVTEEMLDGLWEWACNDGDTTMGSWVYDKPHQVISRLVLLITRLKIEANAVKPTEAP